MSDTQSAAHSPLSRTQTQRSDPHQAAHSSQGDKPRIEMFNFHVSNRNKFRNVLCSTI